jgi:hypothetical protein
MAYFASAGLLGGGPDYLAAQCNLRAVIFEYTLADTYETVFANILASTAMAPTDFTNSATGNDILCTIGQTVDTYADAAETSSHIAYLDTVGEEVILVLPEDSLISIGVGDQIIFPESTLTWHQPTGA